MTFLRCLLYKYTNCHGGMGMFRILKDYYKIILLFVSLIIAMAILMMSFSASLENDYQKEAQKSFYSDSQKNAEIIHNIIKTDSQNLRLISANLSYNNVYDKDAILQNLDEHVKSGVIDSAAVVYKTGMAYSTNRKVYQLSNKRGLKEAFIQNRTEVDKDVVLADTSFADDGSMSIQFYTPIFQGNNIVAVLAMEIPQTDMQKHFCGKMLESSQECTIIDSSGEIISSKIISYERINHFDQVGYFKIDRSYDIDECRKMAKAGEDFSLLYTYNNQQYFNSYHSIGVDGLYLVSSTNMQTINTISKSAKGIEISLVIRLFLIIIVFTVFVMNIQSKTIKCLKNSEAEMETLTSNIPGGVLRRTNSDKSRITYMSDGFYNLTGFSQYELDSLYKHEYADIISDEDREAALASLDRQLKNGNCFAVEYRLNKESVQWVLEHGQIVSGKNGVDTIYSVLVDITDSKVFQQKLEISEKRYQAIIEKTDSVVYEWNMTEDTVSISDVWLKKFGYRPVVENFIDNLEKAQVIHPDDMFKYKELASNAKEGAPYGEIVVRIRKLPKEYVWCKICLMTIFSNTEKPIAAVGIILDVDKEKRETESMQIMAEQDSLTKLYNKCTCQRLIQEYLVSADKEEISAFIIIDIDNFKGVNDNLGHMFGDAVLTDVATKIKKIFRSTDIVGRIGGDEFAVFMKNAGSEKIIEDKVNALCEAFRQTFSGTNSDYKISGSIGVAVYSKDADNYKELFKLADKALYYAKNSGKDKYCFYDREMIEENELTSIKSPRITRIDSCVSSDSISRSFKNNIERYVLDMLNDTRDVNSMVNMIISLLGKHYNVSRVAIYENNIDGTYSSNTYEWCNEGIDSRASEFENFRYSDYPAYFDEYNSDGVLYCTDIKNLSTKLYKFFERLNIRSVLYISIRLKGKHKGAIGFESINDQRLWTKDEIETLFFVSKILGSFVIKDRYRMSLLEANENQETVINALNSYAYVVDRNTYELLFVNKKLSDQCPVKTGERCYKMIMKQDSPCQNCPIGSAHEYSEIYNEATGTWISCSASEIEWKDCCNPVLIVGNNVTKYKENDLEQK